MLLLNTNERKLPSALQFKMSMSVMDSTELGMHASLKWQQQQEQIADAGLRLEQSRLLPDISVGYNNMSLQDGIIYRSGNRFQSFQIGLEIPLFGAAQRAKINSAKALQSISKNETALRSKQLQSEYAGTWNQLMQYYAIVQDFEKNALKNAENITATLNKQLQSGEINYLEWTVLNQQSLDVQLDYFQAVKNLNNSIIHLNYLLSK